MLQTIALILILILILVLVLVLVFVLFCFVSSALLASSGHSKRPLDSARCVETCLRRPAGSMPSVQMDLIVCGAVGRLSVSNLLQLRAGMWMQHHLHPLISTIFAEDALNAFRPSCAASSTSVPGKAV